MAKKGKNVEILQNGLLTKLEKPARRDTELLKKHAKTLGISKLEHYDVAFVSTDLKKKLYDVDPEKVR